LRDDEYVYGIPSFSFLSTPIKAYGFQTVCREQGVRPSEVAMYIARVVQRNHSWCYGDDYDRQDRDYGRDGGREEGGEDDEALITETGMIDCRTGIVMTEDRCPLSDIRGVGGADRVVLRRGADMGVLHGGTNEQGDLPAQTDADPLLLRSQLS
jgi:hypothetical protein